MTDKGCWRLSGKVRKLSDKVTQCVLVAEWLAFGTASLTARVRSCGREAYKRLDSSAHTPGSEPSIIGGLVYRESHPWALKRSLDAYGEFQVPITNNFSSSKVDVCFSCAATLCKDKELIIITLMNGNRVVMKRINTWCNNCVRCEVL